MQTLRTGAEWAKRYGITIMDPDGWRRNDGVTMETPITLLDFANRVWECTIMGVKPDDWNTLQNDVRRSLDAQPGTD